MKLDETWMMFWLILNIAWTVALIAVLIFGGNWLASVLASI